MSQSDGPCFTDRLRGLFTVRLLVVLTLACAILVAATVAIVPHHDEMWPGSDREHQQSCLFVEAINKHFGARFQWNMPAKGTLCVMVWGIADEPKQDEIRDWIIAEKAKTALAPKVRLEFYEKKTNEPRPERLLRVIEF